MLAADWLQVSPQWIAASPDWVVSLQPLNVPAINHRYLFDVQGAIQYPAGNPILPPIQNVLYNETNSNIKAFNGHSIEVYSDRSVWDVIQGVYLYPGRDFNP